MTDSFFIEMLRFFQSCPSQYFLLKFAPKMCFLHFLMVILLFKPKINYFLCHASIIFLSSSSFSAMPAWTQLERILAKLRGSFNFCFELYIIIEFSFWLGLPLGLALMSNLELMWKDDPKYKNKKQCIWFYLKFCQQNLDKDISMTWVSFLWRLLHGKAWMITW